MVRDGTAQARPERQAGRPRKQILQEQLGTVRLGPSPRDTSYSARLLFHEEAMGGGCLGLICGLSPGGSPYIAQKRPELHCTRYKTRR